VPRRFFFVLTNTFSAINPVPPNKSVLPACLPVYPLTVYPVLTKPNKRSISAGALSPVNIATRRVETDNTVLLQVNPIF